MKYIDIHCQLDFPDFDGDREEVIRRAQEAEVGMITVGTTYEASLRAVEIAEKYENVWAIVGLHPTHADQGFVYKDYLELARHKKVVGIGECGYDYYRADEKTYKIQHEVFLKHIDLAHEVNKPLMLHLRSTKTKASENINGKNAYADALEVLQEKARKGIHVKGDTHFFAGTLKEAQEFIDLGFYISLTGVVTFTREYDELVKNIPLDRLMSETDAPFVAPIPYRGKRNEPLFVKEIAHCMASLREETEEKVISQLVDNARKLFGI